MMAADTVNATQITTAIRIIPLPILLLSFLPQAVRCEGKKRGREPFDSLPFSCSRHRAARCERFRFLACCVRHPRGVVVVLAVVLTGGGDVADDDHIAHDDVDALAECVLVEARSDEVSGQTVALALLVAVHHRAVAQVDAFDPATDTRLEGLQTRVLALLHLTVHLDNEHLLHLAILSAPLGLCPNGSGEGGKRGGCLVSSPVDDEFPAEQGLHHLLVIPLRRTESLITRSVSRLDALTELSILLLELSVLKDGRLDRVASHEDAEEGVVH